MTFADLAMPPGSVYCDAKIEAESVEGLPEYEGPVPVFFGHYWLPPSFAKEPLAVYIGCLDFSAGLDGPMVAYRWDGERRLQTKNMVCKS